MTETSESPSLEELLSWRRQIVEDLDQARTKLAELQQSVSETEQRLELLDQLISMEKRPASPHTPAGKEKPEGFLDAVERILRDRGEPMNINDLHSALLEDGVPIPGKGTVANVISRIQRSDGRIIRVARGRYGLEEFGVEEKRPTRKVKRAKKGSS